MRYSEKNLDYEDHDIDPVLFILNENNKLIPAEYIEKLLKKYGGIDYKVKNINLYYRAMTHPSYQIRDLTEFKQRSSKTKNKVSLKAINDPSNAIPLQEKSYERLEFAGDAVIHDILAKYIFRRYENQDEGFMTKLRTKIENSDTLASLCSIIGLDKFILVSKYIDVNNGRENNRNILEDAFEAFMGALSEDMGDENFHLYFRFMESLIEREIDFAQLLYEKKNFKDLLLQYFHKQRWEDPTYGLYDVSGPENTKNFMMYVKRRKYASDDGEIISFGVGTSKKKGEQEAAREALKVFGEIRENEDTESEELEEYFSEEN
jgi:dsRNA-specific ribonuclease